MAKRCVLLRLASAVCLGATLSSECKLQPWLARTLNEALEILAMGDGLPLSTDHENRSNDLAIGLILRHCLH